MANLDRNFLASPDFFVSTGENGQTVTITLYPKIQSVGEFEEEAYILTGWKPLFFAKNPFASLYMGEDPSIAGIPRTISPLVYENFTGHPTIDIISQSEQIKNILSGFNFQDFIEKNPVHISRINLRTQNENVLPQQIIVETPNLFNGQCDRQVLDVASKKTADQYQNGIITINDANLIICRNSTLRLEGAFSVSNGDQPENVLPENELYIDITIDKYLSLEKALVENLKLM